MRDSAAAQFDAYHKWLGIPPHEQPPNYYRLLGIAVFEDDPEVIAAAADRQMVHVKSFAAGRHSHESQRLLNELSAARLVLLNAQQKARYDAGLKHAFPLPHVLSPSEHSAEPRTARTTSRQADELAELRRLANKDSQAAVGTALMRSRNNSAALYLSMLLLILTICIAAGTALYLKRPPLRAEDASPSVQSYAVQKPSTTTNVPLSREQPVRSPAVEPQLSKERISGSVRPFEPQTKTNRGESAPSPRQTTLRNVAVRDETDRESATDDAIATAVPIALDLTSRRHVYDVKYPMKTALRVVSVEGLNYPVEILPESGLLTEGRNVSVRIQGIREVELALSRRETGKGLSVVLIEATIETDARDRIPFTVSGMKRIGDRLAKTAEKQQRAIVAMETEKNELVTWIQSPIVKPLAAVGRAKTRVIQLQNAINGETQSLAACQADLAIADKAAKFAAALHQNCRILLAVSDDEPAPERPAAQ